MDGCADAAWLAAALGRPREWPTRVNEPVQPAEQTRLGESFKRGRPLGGDAWTTEMAERLGLEYTLNPRGRPKNEEE